MTVLSLRNFTFNCFFFFSPILRAKEVRFLKTASTTIFISDCGREFFDVATKMIIWSRFGEKADSALKQYYCLYKKHDQAKKSDMKSRTAKLKCLAFYFDYSYTYCLQLKQEKV